MLKSDSIIVCSPISGTYCITRATENYISLFKAALKKLSKLWTLLTL